MKHRKTNGSIPKHREAKESQWARAKKLTLPEGAIIDVTVTFVGGPPGTALGKTAGAPLPLLPCVVVMLGAAHIFPVTNGAPI